MRFEPAQRARFVLEGLGIPFPILVGEANVGCRKKCVSPADHCLIFQRIDANNLLFQMSDFRFHDLCILLIPPNMPVPKFPQFISKPETRNHVLRFGLMAIHTGCVYLVCKYAWACGNRFRAGACIAVDLIVLGIVLEKSGSAATDFGWGSLEMIPESSDGLLRHPKATDASAVAVKDGKLVSGHDICVRLRLDALPDFSKRSFEHGIDGRVDLPVLVVFDELQCTGYCERIR